MFKSRKYRTGTIWCFWRWTEVQSEYIVRLHLIKTPWFAICLHWIKKPDPEPYLHDHPVTFLSIILRGWYRERRGPRYVHGPTVAWRLQLNRWFNFIRATDLHTIDGCDPRTLTLCFMGPKVREWGFHTPRGWIYWRDYYAKTTISN